MRVKFVDASKAEEIKTRWEKMHAPCYLKKVPSKPLEFTVCSKPNTEDVVVELFLIGEMFHPDEQERLKRKVINHYMNGELRRIEAKVESYYK